MASIYDHKAYIGKARGSFNIHQENPATSESTSDQSSLGLVGDGSSKSSMIPMTTSKLANQQRTPLDHESTVKKLHAPVQVGGNSIELLLGRKPKGHTTVIAGDEENIKDMNVWSKRPSLVPASVQAGYNQDGVTAVQVSEEDGPYEDNQSMDMADLKKELEEAKKEIAGLSQQLSQQQVTQQTMEQVMATPAPINLRLSEDPDVLLNRLNMRCTSNHSENDRPVYDGPGPSHSMDANTAWGDPRNVVFGKPTGGTTGWDANTIAAWNGAGSTQPSSSMTPFDMRANMQAQMSRGSSGSSMPPGPYRGWTNQPPPNMPSSSGLSDPPSPFEYSQHPDMAAWQPRPAAVPFTPAASDFQQAWNRYPGQVTQGPQQQYMPPVEPMNYRRLLDRNVSCNWKYIVDKIICSNDQQASIFLQQKLKVSPAEMKHELIDAIIAQAYPLMINRFGNFLVQRCLEHGTIEQVNAIANTIRGKTLELSMDAFGCHVIQKAFDVVPESYKASMVHELLRQIPQTVVHRYACHVWQKLFELRWSDSPPQIMKYVNDALHTMWHEVALGETGSLVVQNIFENCLDEDKRACIDEVLSHADLIARGQFGNWCIQHICEHGAPADRSRAIEHVLAHSVDYSTDQFASKVVEKCLKVSGPDFLDRYLQKICEGRPDRPRMPLIDIAGDQYGNYLIQYILLNTDHHNREAVAQNIRKHMVSLRGSKFGSRVAMLCNNPAVSTRPGPPTPFMDRSYPPYNHSMGRVSMPGPCR